ncbi:MAG: helix-turn-helix transcriptional regulator [Oscillospiraceae bacterium]|nr:helix-turn-helix transcriptional regulator [Oscillospiraceae bacterium]
MFPKYEYRNTSITVMTVRGFHGYPARFHKHIELMCVTEGEMRVIVDGKNYVLQPGELYITFPNILHAVHRSEGNSIVIIADNELFPAYTEAMTHFKPACPVLRAGEVSQLVCGMFRRVSELGKESVVQNQTLITGYIGAIVGEVLGKVKLIERSSDSDLVQQLVMYLLSHYTSEITLEDVARDLGYSKYYISHVITDAFQCNFRSLVNSYRVSMAQSLLLSTTKSVSEIAYECGFKNQSSFNRIFLKHCDVPPNRFRRQCTAATEPPSLYVRG